MTEKAKRNAIIVSLRRAGWTYPQIGQKFGINQVRARAIVEHQRQKVADRMRRRPSIIFDDSPQSFYESGEIDHPPRQTV